MKSLAINNTYGHYLNINFDQHGKIMAEYVWIDGTGINLRSKSRTLPHAVKDLSEIPEWNYDGSSCGQATTSDSEVIVKPVAFFADPFRGGDNILVLCSSYIWADTDRSKLLPANTNFRHFAEPIFESTKTFEPWFGIEQEYTLFEAKTSFIKWPLGWPEGGYPAAQGPYYCSVGSSVCFGRIIMDLHYKACLAANITISGTNAEVLPGQWEFQIGPCEGIDVGDHLWMARYLLFRVAEDFNINVDLHPKPIAGNWNGSGCHTNYSTNQTRGEDGLEFIVEAIEKLKEAHSDHIKVYGLDNNKRLTGKHETSSMKTFKYGVGDRGASIRIPTMVNKDGRGYFEDRRPASNVDPYVVSAMIASTTLLDKEHEEDLVGHYEKWIEEQSKSI